VVSNFSVAPELLDEVPVEASFFRQPPRLHHRGGTFIDQKNGILGTGARQSAGVRSSVHVLVQVARGHQCFSWRTTASSIPVRASGRCAESSFKCPLPPRGERKAVSRHAR